MRIASVTSSSCRGFGEERRAMLEAGYRLIEAAVKAPTAEK